MIAKEYRLTEREVRKVLSRRKPFFSYMFIANVLENKLAHGRCGILLSGKVTKGSVNRNFFRRKFYDSSFTRLQKLPFDIVLVPKKGTLLDYKDWSQVAEFEKNIMFLMKKIGEEKNSSQKTVYIAHKEK
jgi:ribonuclease P protein component